MFIDDKKKRKRIRSTDGRQSLAAEQKKRKPTPPHIQLQQHKLEFEEFLKEFDLPQNILCPFCNREYGKPFFKFF